MGRHLSGGEGSEANKKRKPIRILCVVVIKKSGKLFLKIIMVKNILDLSIKNKYKKLEDRMEVYKKNLIVDGEHKLIIPIQEVHELETNPKSATPQDMVRLGYQIEKLGQYKPLIIKPDGTILGGNHRIIKYREKGYTWVWVSVVYPETSEEEMEYVLSDNDHIATYLEAELAEQLKGLRDLNISAFKVNVAPGLGIADLLEKYADSPPEDEVPGISAGPARSQYGELYQLGNHRLLCGDATKEECYRILMGKDVAQMVFTDPPYNVDYNGSHTGEDNRKEDRRIMNYKMSDGHFYEFMLDSLTQMVRVTHGAFYVCMSSSELHNLRPAFEKAGGHFQSFIIWVKNTFTLGRADWQNQYEPILYGWNKKENHYFAGFRDEGNVWQNLETLKASKDENGYYTFRLGLFTLRLKIPGDKLEGSVCKKRDCVDVWEEKKPSKNADHPTMKPVKLVAKAIRSSSHKAEIILDPFGGSGTTLIASEQTGRKCVMMELDPKYVDVIIERWENLTGQTAVLVGKMKV